MFARGVISSFGFLVAAAYPVCGDVVKLFDKPAFEDVQVSGFRDGRLLFRGVSGQVLRKPYEHVEWIELADRPRLSDAESHRATDRGRAVNMYERALRESDSDGLRDFIRMRLCQSADEAGLFDRSVGLYLDMLRERIAIGPLRPTHPGRAGSTRNAAALDLLQQALRDRSLFDEWPRLQRMRLDLLLIDGRALATESADGDAAAASRTATQRRRMFARRSSSDAGSAQVMSDSLVFNVARRALDAGADARPTADLLRRAMPNCDAEARQIANYLLVRADANPNQPLTTAEALRGLAANIENAALAAEVWYHAGFSYARGGRSDLARDIWAAAVSRDDIPEDWRRTLNAALTDLEPE